MQKRKIFAFISFIFLLIFSYPFPSQATEASPSSDSFFSKLFGSEAREDFYKVVPLKSNGAFSLKNVNGSVTISTWDKEKVEIKAEKIAKRSRRDLKEVRIEVETMPDFVSVDTIFPRLRNIRVEVKYEVKVPKGVSLKRIRSVNGGVYISGLLGDVSASSTNGKVKLDGASGKLSFSTTNGSIEAKDIRGDIEARTTNGSIKLEILSIEDKLEAKTVNGSITLKFGVLKKINADIKARAINGKVYLDFPVTFKSIYKSKHTLEGEIGQGGPQVSLRTVNGSIRITD